MPPKNSLISVRVSEELKDQAASVLAQYGLTVSDATRILLTKIVNEGGLPPFLVSSPEQYDTWFRARVREAMEDTQTRNSSCSSRGQKLEDGLQRPVRD
ncbi:type II toxin-antitoxin system RelB/DinJ family antitoxin [Rhizobium sp. MHM7A]|uniref:type II toxin-antitoxin system RelB/DinJ family antitoxin n=1 Tax=Rhizobium sp. MHM7A TaxID=2583233 RepID=UPI00148703C9|nr:type II toxin-antitoxin system RelB/DinJ family antitoxin [Rhizobium sp. MHM7A]